MDRDGSNEKHPTPQPPHEESRYITLRNFLIFAAGLGVLIAIFLAMVALAISFFAPLVSPELPLPAPPEPRIQPQPAEDLLELLAEQRALLDSYAVVDEDEQVARIPIERAMEILTEQGLPVAPDALQVIDKIEADDSGFPHPALVPFELPDPDGLIPIVPDEEGVEEVPAEDGPTPEELALDEEAVARGQELFQELGCSGCHTEADTSIAPTLVGLFGEEVPLESGEVVEADVEYIRRSILEPQAQIHAGYSPIMPSFAQLSEEELNALIAYIVSLE